MYTEEGKGHFPKEIVNVYIWVLYYNSCTLKVVAESTIMESNASFPFCVNFV